MTTSCIHGFPVEHCAACHTCQHGFQAGLCGRCQAATTASARRRFSPSTPADAISTEHNGFEIFYTPAVTGWQFRGPDSTTSSESYRSVFLARKAIDSLATSPVAGTSRKRDR